MTQHISFDSDELTLYSACLLIILCMFLIRILFCFTASFSVILPDPEPCPWNLDLTLARKGCRGCPRDHICCLSDGGEVCIPPLFQKPGFCPHRHWDFEHCGDLCSCDGDCPNNEKCCSTGCGHMCMAPVLVKPGHCPRSRHTSKRCAEFCSNDSDCPDNDKCCSNGCGRECMEPQIGER
uniref:WAP four-disulfide core domain 2 n=1 Tax=Amphilophus citrinellus TaxID=61819 RepID=A0A3Q0T0R4_AMPCI